MRNLGWLFLAASWVVLGVCEGVFPQVAPEQDLSESVVLIRCARQDFDYTMPWKQGPMGQGLGTGFIVSGNRILTNAHNVSNAKYIEVKKQDLARRYRSRVGFIGHDCDLAILTVDEASFFDGTAELELGEIPQVNTTVSTYGFPLGGSRISVTEGVVSRIETGIYAHSGADSHLVIQTDAAINPGNSGGPVIQAGKVVGVAFQGLRQAENIGYMIPTTVIRHFLGDVEDGKYDGFGSLGVTLYPGLHSTSYKDYLKVPAQQEGIVVVSTMMHSSVESILQKGDVITRIGEYDVDNDGMVRIYGMRLHLSEVIENKQIGETVELEFYRQGQMVKETATVALNRPILEYARQYDRPPRYVCFAGLTFVPVTRNFLETWGREWLTDIPYYLRYLFYHSTELNTDRQLKEYVVMSEILPDQVNSYADEFANKPVESINEVPVHSIDDVPRGFEQVSGGFHILKFMGSGRELVIDAEQAKLRDQLILDKYDVPAPKRLEKGL